MVLKRIIVCLHCGQRVAPPDEIETLEVPEFRTDHGPACICMHCVVARSERRIAERRRWRS